MKALRGEEERAGKSWKEGKKFKSLGKSRKRRKLNRK